ncbi:MAG: hypothetical protein JOZ72_14275 [Alphaproteobacteria bacterium]|nr:hypothetical protein [Alphaproteobacteria bacterium]
MQFRTYRLAALSSLCLLGACAVQERPLPPLTTLSGRQCAASADIATAAVLLYKTKDETKQVVDMADAMPCLKTASGAALYVVYGLPQTDEPYVIGVASTSRGGTLFAPQVMLLAGDGSVKRTFPGKQMEFRGEGYGVRIPKHGDEAYIVVASDPATVGSSTSRINDATQVTYASNGYATYAIHSGTESQDTYIYAHNGRVTVTVTSLVPPK